MKHKILIADDEAEIRNLLRLYLENEGYDVTEAKDGVEALRLLRDEKPDLCLLDIMMPVSDGYRVLKELRETSNIPVIFISAKDADSEKILGLNLGADDYIAKPFDPLEAVARVNSNIRRFYSLGAASGAVKESVKIKDLELDIESCILKKQGQPIELTSVEYKLMELFMTHPGKDEFFLADNNIMVCISKLRSKLSDDPSAYIKTLRGLGYRMEN